MARTKSKDSWELFFTHDFFPEIRTIYIGAVKTEHEDKVFINEYSAENLIKGLIVLQSDSQEKPINIVLNSKGGDVHQAFAMYDAIKACPCEVIITATGSCMSAGSIILQAGDIRRATPLTTFMIHDGEDGYSGNPRDFERWAEYGKYQRTEIYRIYAEKSDQDVSYWRRRCANDYIFNAETALKEKLIDEIVR